MVILNKFGYLERRVVGNKSKPRIYRPQNFRDWWFGSSSIFLGTLKIPKKLQGKKLKFKIEVIEDKNKLKPIKD